MKSWDKYDSIWADRGLSWCHFWPEQRKFGVVFQPLWRPSDNHFVREAFLHRLPKRADLVRVLWLLDNTARCGLDLVEFPFATVQLRERTYDRTELLDLVKKWIKMKSYFVLQDCFVASHFWNPFLFYLQSVCSHFVELRLFLSHLLGLVLTRTRFSAFKLEGGNWK